MLRLARLTPWQACRAEGRELRSTIMTASDSASYGSIFISYRHGDSSHLAGEHLTGWLTISARTGYF